MLYDVERDVRYLGYILDFTGFLIVMMAFLLVFVLLVDMLTGIDIARQYLHPFFQELLND